MKEGAIKKKKQQRGRKLKTDKKMFGYLQRLVGWKDNTNQKKTRLTRKKVRRTQLESRSHTGEGSQRGLLYNRE